VGYLFNKRNKRNNIVYNEIRLNAINNHPEVSHRLS